ncbi:MAG TPA: LysR family transcriptional regulator substrate-binding protein [Opitutaceae bacterium]|nr:LysR family transcriptional regulator substrate-binding protein [Opitutaceae bacterium]
MTEAGTAFLERARRILFEVENAAKELSDHPNLERRITIGAVQTVMPYLVVPLIARCRKELPNLTIDAREDFRSDLVRAVLEGELDLAVVPLPVDDHRLSVEPLLTEPLLLVVGKDHPIATRSDISINEIAEESFVSMGSSSSLAEQIRVFFGGHNFAPKISYRCAQVPTVKLLVSMGMGISILPQLARQEHDRNLVYLRLTGAEPTRDLVVIRHLQRYQSRGAEQFLTLLREHTREKHGKPAAAETH